MIILVGVIFVGIAGYGYNVYSSAAIQALHDRYNAVIDVHVNVPPASNSSVGLGKSTELWTLSAVDLDFRSVAPGNKSAIMRVNVTYTMLEALGYPDSMWMFVTTDLSSPGVHLIGNSQKIVKGVYYQYPISIDNNISKTLSFQVSVDPGTEGKDIQFHITISHDYLGGYATLSAT
jgi:hypothetical protein